MYPAQKQLMPKLATVKKGDFGAEGREGAALFAGEDGARGGEGAGAVPLGWMCVVGKRGLLVE